MDEKKKIMVLAFLGVMFLGVGAFTFIPKGEEPVPTTAKEPAAFLKENEEAKAAAAAPLLNPQVAVNLAARDPFRVPTEMSTPSIVGSNTPIPVLKRPTKSLGGPLRIAERSGDNLNLEAMPKAGDGDIEVKPVEPELPFGYVVGGVAVGARPAAVFKDGQGNQRLVMQGADLDGDTKVTAVHMDHVVVVYRGKTLTLRVGGESVAK